MSGDVRFRRIFWHIISE